MKAFKIVPSIAEYMDFRTLAKELNLGERDLILTNEYIYNPTIAALNLGCHTCFQEKFGGGEPTDVMVDAILDDLRGKEFDRIIAVADAEKSRVTRSADFFEHFFSCESGAR